MKPTKSIISTILCLFILTISSSEAKTKKDKAYLSDLVKKQYKLVKYHDLQSKPKSFKNKKLKLEMTYMGRPNEFSSFYEARMSPSKYLYLKIADQYKEGTVPVLISRKYKKDLITKVTGMALGTTVTVYGRIKKLRKKRGEYGDNPYYLQVDDIESGSVEANIQNNKLVGLSKNAKKGDYEKIQYYVIVDKLEPAKKKDDKTGKQK